MPAVFIHGVPDTPALWGRVRSHLSRTDILAPNLPGFGVPAPEGWTATKEAYEAWLVGEIEAVGEPVDLVGHDWGGILCLRVATTRQDLIRTVAVGSCPIDPEYVWHDTAQLWQTPEVGEQVMEAITRDTMGPALEAAGLDAEAAAEAASHIDEEMKACILALYRSAVHFGTEWEYQPGANTRPALVLWGDQDIYVPERFGHRMAEWLGAAIEMYDCGHWWPSQRPVEVAAALEQLWAQG
jgi:pimeloyl-ACP methyl ester carboxylesterase